MNYKQRIRTLRENAEKTQTQVLIILGLPRPCMPAMSVVQMKCLYAILFLYANIIRSLRITFLDSQIPLPLSQTIP